MFGSVAAIERFRRNENQVVFRKADMAINVTISTSIEISREPSPPSGEKPKYRSIKSQCFDP
jgi:hypothetical protein